MLWLNDVRVADPTDVDIGIHRISKADRTASGLMVMDIIAIKRTVTVTYNLIGEPELRHLLDILASRTFHILRHPDPQASTGERTTTVYVGDVRKSMWRRIDGIRYWEEVSISLIER